DQQLKISTIKCTALQNFLTDSPSCPCGKGFVLFQLRKVLFPELFAWPCVLRSFRCRRPHLHTADLAGDCLWQIDKFQPAHTLVRRQYLAAVLKDGESGLARRLATSAQSDECLDQRMSQR